NRRDRNDREDGRSTDLTRRVAEIAREIVQPHPAPRVMARLELSRRVSESAPRCVHRRALREATTAVLLRAQLDMQVHLLGQLAVFARAASQIPEASKNVEEFHQLAPEGRTKMQALT